MEKGPRRLWSPDFFDDVAAVQLLDVGSTCRSPLSVGGLATAGGLVTVHSRIHTYERNNSGECKASPGLYNIDVVGTPAGGDAGIANDSSSKGCHIYVVVEPMMASSPE